MNKVSPKVRKRIILFDFFGVLSTSVYTNVIRKFIQKKERNKWIKKIKNLDRGNISENDFIKAISKQSGISEKNVWLEVLKQPKLNKKLIHFIEKKLKPSFTIGLLTNITRTLLERILSNKLDLFDIQIVSSDIGIIKPNIKIFRHALLKSKYAVSKIIFIDDGERNIKIAKNFGMHGIIYKNFNSFKKEINQYI